jgi:hypothetical protein
MSALPRGTRSLPASLNRPHPDLLPEGEGTGGFLFDILARHTLETRDVPTAEGVAPRAETTIRPWDDAAYYEQCRRAALVPSGGIPTASRRTTATSSAA